MPTDGNRPVLPSHVMPNQAAGRGAPPPCAARVPGVPSAWPPCAASQAAGVRFRAPLTAAAGARERSGFAPGRRSASAAGPRRATPAGIGLLLTAASWLACAPPLRAQPTAAVSADAGPAPEAVRASPAVPATARAPLAEPGAAARERTTEPAARAPGAQASSQLTAAAQGPGARRGTAAAPPSARACFDAAQADYFAGHLAEARRGFECAYAQLPSPELLWNLARVSERMGDVEQGARYFRQYLQTAKLTARERQGVEKRIAALAALAERQREASVLKPGPEREAALGAEARTFFERGAKLYRAGHYKAAAAAFTAALQLSDAPELHYNLAVAAERLGENADACDHYRAYLDASPDAPDRDAIRARLESLRSAP